MRRVGVLGLCLLLAATAASAEDGCPPAPVANPAGEEAAALGLAAAEALARHDPEGAVPLLEREVRLRTTAPNAPALAEAWRRLGMARERAGDLEGALAAQGEALATSTRASDRGGEAAAHSNLGNLHITRGAYATALSHHEQALERLEGTGSDAHVATTLANLAMIYDRLGDPERALAYQERALAGFKRAGDRARAAAGLANLGGIYWSLGEPERAAQTLERARRLAAEGNDREGVAQCLTTLGHVYASLDQGALAVACLEEALAMRRERRDRAGIAAAQGSLGLVKAQFGRLEEALRLQRAALAEAEVLGDADLAVRSLWGMAATRWLAGEPAQAVEIARRAVEALPSVVRGLSDGQGTTSRAMRAGVFDVGARAAEALGDVEALFFFLESGRAGALLESLGGREALREVVLPEALRRAERAARGRETRALAAYRRSLDGEDLAETRTRRAEFQAAREAVHDVVDRIQREAKAAADLVYPTPSSLEEVRGSLEDGVALVEYAFVGDRALAVVATAAEARIVPLGPAAAIHEACRGLRAEARGVDPSAAVAALSALVASPLNLPAGVRRVLVSPDGPLAQVPFALLLGPREVSYVPSATTLRLLFRGRERTGVGVLSLGDPDYETDGQGANRLARMSSGVGFVPLPGTREEAEAVGDVVLLGSEASEAGLRFALSRRPRWASVHLACHGVVDPERPLLSALALTPAGLDDGFLTALEVFGLAIPTDLAVLSACQTGRGRVVKGEGLIGFLRAFLFAGAPRVVVSLWNGDDRSTRVLMEEFYRRWKAGEPAATALRASQDLVRSRPPWAHPYYWAGWCLWGLAD